LAFSALLLLYCCFTVALLILLDLRSYPALPAQLQAFSLAQENGLWCKVLYCCFTAALLLLYCCFTAALL
jgi:hypothetical protein